MKCPNCDDGYGDMLIEYEDGKIQCVVCDFVYNRRFAIIEKMVYTGHGRDIVVNIIDGSSIEDVVKMVEDTFVKAGLGIDIESKDEWEPYFNEVSIYQWIKVIEIDDSAMVNIKDCGYRVIESRDNKRLKEAEREERETLARLTEKYYGRSV